MGMVLVAALVGFGAGHYVASPESAPRPPVDQVAAGAMSAEEAEAAVLDVLGEVDPFVRASRLAGLLPTLDASAAPVVGQLLFERIRDLRAGDVILLAQFWALHEPKVAMNWALAVSPKGYRSAVVNPTMQIWARLDPRAAQRHLGGAMSAFGPNTKTAQRALVRGWFESGRPGLLEYIRDLGMSPERQRAARELVRIRVARDGSGAVVAWAEALSDDDERFKLTIYRQMASELAIADPPAAVAWCEEHCDGPYGDNMLQLVAFGWAGRDGPATMEWLSKQPAGRARNRAVQDAYSGWRRMDPREPWAWFEAIGIDGVEPWLIPGAEVYAKELAWSDPPRGLTWLEVIEEPQRRENAIIAIAGAWRHRDEEAAEAWLEQSNLSEEARERARSTVASPRPKKERPNREQPANQWPAVNPILP
ncbi:MAG: hypothetical protein JRG92_13245 [Deltaproteobacteria bacterium]|nr:hypothetical protein [Deltaproteobacteria bacterium]MBW2384598.1 hypothetical protein [Deltaproteobacteria bacterium]MBW2698238.1 hypothetical protein [Deltaproteobacteria bacterium]